MSRMGINKLSSILKNMVSRTPLKDLERKLTNHSSRKTSVRKMKSDGYVNSQIKGITGHTNAKSLEAYDSGDEKEMHGLSNAISKSSSNFTTSSQQELKDISKERNFSFFKTMALALPQCENIFTFENCNNVTINTTDAMKISTSKKRKRVIIDDSDEEI